MMGHASNPWKINEMKGTRKKDPYVVLFSTTNRLEEAHRIAHQLIAARLVACVNIVPSISSVYRWKGSVQKDTEVLMIMKTKKSRISRLEKSLRAIHSYETPELIALPIVYGLPEYLKWIDDSLAIEKSAVKS